MKRIKDRIMTPLLKSQLITQEIRINEAGASAYQDYTNPKEQGTIFSDRFKDKPLRTVIRKQNI